MFILRLKALKIDTISRLRKKVKTTSISFVLAQHNILPLNLYIVFSICSSQTYYFGTQNILQIGQDGILTIDCEIKSLWNFMFSYKEI